MQCVNKFIGNLPVMTDYYYMFYMSSIMLKIGLSFDDYALNKERQK